jgi:hypothetical protein
VRGKVIAIAAIAALCPLALVAFLRAPAPPAGASADSTASDAISDAPPLPTALPSAAAPQHARREPPVLVSNFIDGPAAQFSVLPEGQRPPGMHALAADLEAWLIEPGRVSADPKLNALDCAAPPCLIVVDYDAATAGDEFIELIVRQLPQLNDMPGLEHDSAELDGGRRRVWFYYAEHGPLRERLVAQAHVRITAAREAR